MNQEVRINLPFCFGFDVVGPFWAFALAAAAIGALVGKYLL